MSRESGSVMTVLLLRVKDHRGDGGGRFKGAMNVAYVRNGASV